MKEKDIDEYKMFSLERTEDLLKAWEKPYGYERIKEV